MSIKIDNIHNIQRNLGAIDLTKAINKELRHRDGKLMNKLEVSDLITEAMYKYINSEKKP